MSITRITLDTNILLENPEILNDGDAYVYVVPAIVLKELDQLKRNRQDLGYSARIAIKYILNNLNKIDIDFNGYEASSNDEKIIEIAKTTDELYTEDLLMTILAKKQGVKTYNPLSFSDEEYKGYVELLVEDDQEDLVQKIYETNRSNLSKKLIDKYLLEIPSPQEYVIIKHGNFEAIYKLDVKTNTYFKQNGLPKTLKIKPKDIKQHIALLSAISDVPLTIIDGLVGAGKSILGIAAAMHWVEQKNAKHIYISRAPFGIDSRYDIGFLPGSLGEKLSPWMGGVLSNLEFLYNGKSEEIFDLYFRHFPLNMAQGYSIHNSVVIVDEVQFLTVNVMKQLISRIAEGSKLIVLGDEAQTYNTTTRSENGLRLLKKLLPSEHIEYIKLDKIYRGPLAELSLKLGNGF